MALWHWIQTWSMELNGSAKNLDDSVRVRKGDGNPLPNATKRFIRSRRKAMASNPASHRG